MSDFRSKVLKIKESRTHSIRNSIGVYDAYRYLQRNKWFDIGRPLTSQEFYRIIRSVNNLMATLLIKGKSINLPYRMGRLELRKRSTTIRYKGNKLINTLPIDWDRTLKLWSEDEEAYKERSLVKTETKEVFRFHYDKSRATFENKSFYRLKVNRRLKLLLKQEIINGNVDAYML